MFCDRCGKEIVEASEHRRVEVAGQVNDCCAGKCAEAFENMQKEANKMATEARIELQRKLKELRSRWLGKQGPAEAVDDDGGTATIQLP